MGRNIKRFVGRTLAHDLLHVWAKRQGKLNWSDVARDWGVTRGFLHALKGGLTRPGLELAAVIQDYTGGIVQMRAWCERSLNEAQPEHHDRLLELR